MNWGNVWRAVRRAECVRRLYRDERAQAMTEAALVMPIVVIVFIAAHEFMWMNEFKYLVGRASRLVVWGVAEHDNYPELVRSNPAGTADVLKTRATTLYTQHASDAFKMLFDGQLGVAGHSFTETSTTDTYAFHKSFTFSTDIADGGGDAGQLNSNINNTGGASGGGMLSGLADALGNFSGEIVTGMSVPGVGFLRFGPELPVRGQAQGGFTVAWKPLFHALITSADNAPGGGSGNSSYAFYGSAEAQTRYQTEVLQTYKGMSDVVPIGMTGDVAGDKGRVYGRFAVLTHDWRPLDNSDGPFDDIKGTGENAAGDSFHFHVKGWTLLGVLSGNFKPPGASGGGFASDIGSFLDEAFFPFKCCLRTDRIGHEDEDTAHLTKDFPTF